MTWPRRLGFRLLERTLRREFRQIVWLGDDIPELPRQPVILYANHHAFFDGMVLGYLIERILQRPAVLWFQELERFPFFRILGALPFPAAAAQTRATTVRTTQRRWRTDPRTVMIYFPEGKLHAWEEGLAWPADDRFARLERLADDIIWWPVALRVAGWEDHRPTMYIKAGQPQRGTTGMERAHLEALMTALERPDRHAQRVLLEGRRGPHDRWDFSLLNPLLSRF